MPGIEQFSKKLEEFKDSSQVALSQVIFTGFKLSRLWKNSFSFCDTTDGINGLVSMIV